MAGDHYTMLPFLPDGFPFGLRVVEYELSILVICLLLVTGLVSGFINTLAGGGSMLTLPALMMLGMPADVANATNRVGVLMQSVTGAKGFSDQDKLDKSTILQVLVPALIGALQARYWLPSYPSGFLNPFC